ncbi:response regulator transcription factor [Streptococcus thoraltensis]|uniref:response regulator transcription factor n=1 Tax=Streptococcus thoraltensis TaxID=55085 RepID=UPI00035DE36A|nr:response regulator transcription factor [Streptococcus thoraltensis]MDY4761776.1 response regulator transcription factor [Streptococcus thoraltensis]
MFKILVVEDDKTINQVVCEFLKANGYVPDAAFDGAEGLEKWRKQSYDLIILDIMLPSIGGIEVLEEIRKTSDIPIIMLTALDDEYTQLVSFNHLISDYVTKPFSPLILIKRIENALRSVSQNERLTVGELTIDLAELAVSWKNVSITLTKKEFEILEYLAQHHQKLVMREQLMDAIWGYCELDSRVLDNHIKNIRKKMPGIPLKTVTGMGYLLGDRA